MSNTQRIEELKQEKKELVKKFLRFLIGAVLGIFLSVSTSLQNGDVLGAVVGIFIGALSGAILLNVLIYIVKGIGPAVKHGFQQGSGVAGIIFFLAYFIVGVFKSIWYAIKDMFTFISGWIKISAEIKKCEANNE